MTISPPTTFSLEHVLHAEHVRLVRLCAYLSGDRDAADDLAQETLIEAWRQRHKLIDPDGAGAWLRAQRTQRVRALGAQPRARTGTRCGI